MPEIKNQFTGGKMNKDLDERLVPNGQYRDAMNIQVATSEGSGVGTAQNILGNEEIKVLIPTASGISSAPFTMPSSARIVGSISDEKIDTMYYLLWSTTSDYILSWKSGDKSPRFVFIDDRKDVLKFPRNKIVTGINVIDGMLFWTDTFNEPRKINIQRCKDGTRSLEQTRLINTPAGIDYSSDVVLEEKHITVIKKGPQVAPGMQLHSTRQLDKNYTAVINISSPDSDPSGDAASFITYGNSYGWNNFSGITTTFTPGDGEFSDNRFYVKIFDILSPTDPNTIISYADPVDSLLNLTGWYPDDDPLVPTAPTVADIATLVGRKVVLQAYDEDGGPPGLPLTDFVIKGTIIGANSSNGGLGIEVTTIDGFPPQVLDGQGQRKYVIDIFEEPEKLFEFKFPRFSYRYKYEDGEYSTFAPFTQVAFVPGAFDYHPRKGYNIGMTNRLKKVDLVNIITQDTPKDVVAIDILFKDDASPSVYIVDTIRPDDYAISGFNLWTRMLKSSADSTLAKEVFSIKREAISSIIPSNQLLRPWDNVPKKALAQDVTGNRVVYANYVQNYDLLSHTGEKYIPNFIVQMAESPTLELGSILNPSMSLSTSAFKSIKSLREYQLGVVFLDEYGRETPVISNASGTTRLTKTDGNKVNKLKVQFSSDDYPQSLTHFKFYVKETSSEYYNMAMDRWYSAGDGNIWLAFPSSDRNKIDIDTFLILKKGSDQDTLVAETARYKVLAIESEAPDFIKTQKRKTFTKTHRDSPVTSKIFNFTDMPLEGVTNFKMNYAAFNATSGQDIAITEDELYIEFGLLGSDQVSDRYKINSVTNSWVNPTATFTPDDTLSVELDKPLGSDVNFISNGGSSSASLIIDTATVQIYKYKTENLDKFDGRFFVKIYFDEVFRNNIETTTITEGSSRVTSSQKVYSMEPDMVKRHTEDLERFLTRGYGAPRNEFVTAAATDHANTWFPQNFYSTTVDGNGGSSGNGARDYNGCEGAGRGLYQYGYYVVDEFSANAAYFRRYREKMYTDRGYNSSSPDYGSDQYDGSNPSLTQPEIVNRLNANDRMDVRALVHLKKSGSSPGTNPGDGSDLVGYAEGQDAFYWKDADDWYKEFGYHTGVEDGDHRSMYHRAASRLQHHGAGVTSNWGIGGSGASGNDGTGVRRGDGSSGNYVWSYQWITSGSTILQTYANNSQNWGIRYREANNGYNSDRVSARDTEVWFIDKGPYIGSNNSGVGQLKWTQSSYYPEGQGNGLQEGSTYWRMELGFGGIHVNRDCATNATKYNGDPIDNFWNVGNWNQPDNNNPDYTDFPTTNFINNINTGYKLRWKEDPGANVYTISGNVTTGGRMRHSDGPSLPSGVGSGARSTWRENNTGIIKDNPDTGLPEVCRDLRSMAEGLSFNLTKRWRVRDITPKLEWDPTSEYLITGGSTIKLDCVSHVGTSTGFSANGYRCSWVGADDLRVHVQDISVVADGVYSTLHEGMGLTSFVRANGGSFSPVKPLIVRRIQKRVADDGSRYYTIIFGGYLEPLLQVDHNDLLGVEHDKNMPISWAPDLTGGLNNIEGGFPLIGAETFTFEQYGMNGYSPNSEFNINTICRFSGKSEHGAIASVGYTLEFIEEIQPVEVLSENPAIWETEPKDTTALDIYYEACGSIPTQITEKTIASALPIGTKFLANSSTYTVIGHNGDNATVQGPFPFVISSMPIDNVQFFRPDDLVVTTSITGSAVVTGTTDEQNISLESNLIDNEYILPWHNCYTFKNGVESNRIRDNFNLPYISNGVKASATLEQEYKEEHRKYGLIYSGVYNSTSGINNLNQFIAAEKITKDVNPIYGSIQKLYSRDSDLVTLCEDKILKIVANKDALFNADGNPQLIATDRVLGQTIPFGGEYGISTNPESFASENYRAYFTDRVRGAVMRLSKDGLTPISDAGMRDYFRDNLKNANQLIGSYDDRNGEYNLSIKTTPTYPVKIIGTGSGTPNAGQ